MNYEKSQFSLYHTGNKYNLSSCSTSLHFLHLLWNELPALVDWTPLLPPDWPPYTWSGTSGKLSFTEAVSIILSKYSSWCTWKKTKTSPSYGFWSRLGYSWTLLEGLLVPTHLFPPQPLFPPPFPCSLCSRMCYTPSYSRAFTHTVPSASVTCMHSTWPVSLISDRCGSSLAQMLLSQGILIG